MRAFGLVTSHWCRLGSGQSVSYFAPTPPKYMHTAFLIPHTFQISRGMIHDSGTRTDDDFLKEPHIYTP